MIGDIGGGRLEKLKPGVYLYNSDIPAGCRGHQYRLHRLVKNVVTFQMMTLVEALTGPDTGLWFVCSVHNFRLRYRELAGDNGAGI